MPSVVDGKPASVKDPRAVAVDEGAGAGGIAAPLEVAALSGAVEVSPHALTDSIRPVPARPMTIEIRNFGINITFNRFQKP